MLGGLALEGIDDASLAGVFRLDQAGNRWYVVFLFLQYFVVQIGTIKALYKLLAGTHVQVGLDVGDGIPSGGGS